MFMPLMRLNISLENATCGSWSMTVMTSSAAAATTAVPIVSTLVARSRDHMRLCVA